MKRFQPLLVLFLTLIFTSCGWSDGQREEVKGACADAFFSGQQEITVNGESVEVTEELKSEVCGCYTATMEENYSTFIDARDASDKEKSEVFEKCILEAL